MPKFGMLNIEPTQSKIREIFLDRIVQAKGLSQVSGLLSDILMPTPSAVLQAMGLLSKGCEGIFRKNKHNGDIMEKRDAWLTLFSSDDPDMIINLIEEYPEFRQIYEEAYEICLNVERVMDMFSKELYELDKNTTQYMIARCRKSRRYFIWKR